MIYKAIIFRGDLATRQQPFLPKIEWLESITCYHGCTNELSLPYVVKFVALVWFNVTKTMSKEVDNNVFVVSSNNETQVSSKNTKCLSSFAYKISSKKN